MSVSELLDNWMGGDAAAARKLDVPIETVAAWRRRRSIPVAYWRRLVAAAEERGRSDASFETLVDACTQPSASVRRKAAPAGTLSDAAAQALAQNLPGFATQRQTRKRVSASKRGNPRP